MRADACADCLAHAWLIGRLAGHLDAVRARIGELLELEPRPLLAAVGGARRNALARELDAFDPAATRDRADAAGLEVLCRCHPEYPAALAELPAPPAVLHMGGGRQRLLALLAQQPVAVVGARRASPYGLDVARALARAVAAAGLSVVSGMALGIDAAAHRGALDAEGARTIAVLPAGADVSYPASLRSLHRRLHEGGVVLSELPPGTRPRRWMFPARNRIIAALGAMTVVVEGGRESGALLTAGWARRLGRPVGAVPGRVTSPLAEGPHALLRDGAHLIRGAEDVLDELFGAGTGARPAAPARAALAPELDALLAALAEGHDPGAALVRAGLTAERGLAALAALELAGRVRREAGGRYAVLP